MLRFFGLPQYRTIPAKLVVFTDVSMEIHWTAIQAPTGPDPCGRVCEGYEPLILYVDEFDWSCAVPPEQFLCFPDPENPTILVGQPIPLVWAIEIRYTFRVHTLRAGVERLRFHSPLRLRNEYLERFCYDQPISGCDEVNILQLSGGPDYLLAELDEIILRADEVIGQPTDFSLYREAFSRTTQLIGPAPPAPPDFRYECISPQIVPKFYGCAPTCQPIEWWDTATLLPFTGGGGGGGGCPPGWFDPGGEHPCAGRCIPETMGPCDYIDPVTCQVGPRWTMRIVYTGTDTNGGVDQYNGYNVTSQSGTAVWYNEFVPGRGDQLVITPGTPIAFATAVQPNTDWMGPCPPYPPANMTAISSGNFQSPPSIQVRDGRNGNLYSSTFSPSESTGSASFGGGAYFQYGPPFSLSVSDPPDCVLQWPGKPILPYGFTRHAGSVTIQYFCGAEPVGDPITIWQIGDPENTEEHDRDLQIVCTYLVTAYLTLSLVIPYSVQFIANGVAQVLNLETYIELVRIPVGKWNLRGPDVSELLLNVASDIGSFGVSIVIDTALDTVLTVLFPIAGAGIGEVLDFGVDVDVEKHCEPQWV